MNRIEFTPLEERLYIMASNTGDLESFKKKSLVTSVLFSILFAGAVWAVTTGKGQLNYTASFACVLTAYALMTCFHILMNMNRDVRCYRNIQRKIALRLFDRTGKEEYRKSAEQAIYEMPERQGFRSMILLTWFFITLLILPFLFPANSCPAQYKVQFAAGATVFFLLLSAKIRISYADWLIQYRKNCYELGTELRRLTRPDAKEKSK